MILTGLGFLAWTALMLARVDAVGLSMRYVGTTTVLFLGLGHLALRLARVHESRLTWAGLRYVVGYALAAFVMTVLAYVRLGDAAMWIGLALAAIGWVWLARDMATRREARPSLSLLCTEFLVGSLLLRVVVQGTQYWKMIGGRSVFTQYWDHLYHLAMIKDGLSHGMPLHGYALESGVGRVAYHPAADTMATVFIKTLRLPVDAAYFRIIMPMMLLAVLAAILVLAILWCRSRYAGAVALVLLGVTAAFITLPPAIADVVGDGGSLAFSYLMLNPPSAVGCVGAMTCLALLAAAGNEPSARILALAGAVAGATTLMTTPIALFVGPAFVVVLLYRIWRRRGAWRPPAIGIAVAIVSALTAYPTTLGRADAPAFRLGGLAPHIMDWGGVDHYTVVLRALVSPLRSLGVFGAELFVLALLVLAMLGWNLLILALAYEHARFSGRRPFAGVPLATQLALAMAGLITLVGLFVAQSGTGYYSSWNVPWHTVQNLWWLGLVAAAVALTAALQTCSRPPWLTSDRLRSAGVLVAVVMLAAAFQGVTTMRQQEHGASLPTAVRTMLETWDSHVPRDAVVVQHFQTESHNWISAIGGRQAVLERASWARDLYPARTAQLQSSIAVLYTTDNAAQARRLARFMGAEYALLKSPDDRSPGLRAIGTPVMSSGAWELLKLDY